MGHVPPAIAKAANQHVPRSVPVSRRNSSRTPRSHAPAPGAAFGPLPHNPGSIATCRPTAIRKRGERPDPAVNPDRPQRRPVRRRRNVLPETQAAPRHAAPLHHPAAREARHPASLRASELRCIHWPRPAWRGCAPGNDLTLHIVLGYAEHGMDGGMFLAYGTSSAAPGTPVSAPCRIGDSRAQRSKQRNSPPAGSRNGPFGEWVPHSPDPGVSQDAGG